MSLSLGCAAPAGPVWTLMIGYFFVAQPNNCYSDLLKRENLRLLILLSLVRTFEPFFLLTLIRCSSDTQILVLKLLSCCSGLSPTSKSSFCSAARWAVGCTATVGRGVGRLLDAHWVAVYANVGILQILKDSGTVRRGFPMAVLFYNCLHVQSSVFCSLEKKVGIIHSL